MKKPNDNDMMALIGKIEEQLIVIEDKVDLLINRFIQAPSHHHPMPPPQAPKPAQSEQQAPKPMQKAMHKAVCADCKSECEVPFVPKADRPVFCKDCFAARRTGKAPKSAPVTVPQVVTVPPPVVSDGPVEHIVGKKPAKKATEKQKEVKKPAAKKKSAPKKKK